MKVWEQRTTNWGALFCTLLTLLVLLHLERDRFQHPFAAPIGVKWEKQLIAGGVNIAPVQYANEISLENTSESDLENVEMIVTNWAKGTEIKSPIGKLAPGKVRRIELINLLSGFPPYPYELDPHDVLIVRCGKYVDKRIPVKELGKDRPLREVEKKQDKENNADKDFWRKVWKWEDDLKRQGADPTEATFKKWLQEKEQKRSENH